MTAKISRKFLFVTREIVKPQRPAPNTAIYTRTKQSFGFTLPSTHPPLIKNRPIFNEKENVFPSVAVLIVSLLSVHCKQIFTAFAITKTNTQDSQMGGCTAKIGEQNYRI